MKIVYLMHQFYPEYYTGTEKFVMNMARMMQRLGHRVKVLSYSFYEDALYDVSRNGILFREFLYDGIPVKAFKHPKPPPDLHLSLENQALAHEAEAILSEEAPDVVHVGHPMRVGELARAAGRLGIPYVMTLTDYWLICPNFILLTPDQRPCEGPGQGNQCEKRCTAFSPSFIRERLDQARELLNHASGVFSPSEFLAALFIKEMAGLKPGIIHHGMNYARIRKNRRVYRGRDNLTFSYMGSFNSYKGVHVLIEAFRGVSHSAVSLKIYGSGPDEAYHASLTDMAGEDERIQFCGVFPDHQAVDVLGSTDVVVVPSLWYENYPLSLHEALACDVPVIASDLGGMAERIREGVNGFLFPRGDSKALRTLLQNMADDPTTLNELKQSIGTRMIPTVEQEAYAYEQAYFRAVNS